RSAPEKGRRRARGAGPPAALARPRRRPPRAGRAQTRAPRARKARAARRKACLPSALTRSRAPPTRWPSGPVHSQLSTRLRAGIGARVLTRSHGIVAGVPGAVKTTVTELAGSRVRLRVQVPAGEGEGRLDRKARPAGRDLDLPRVARAPGPA